MNYLDIASSDLRADEGVKFKIYMDSLGIPSIGIGRNLRDVGLRLDEVDYLFTNDLRDAEKVARGLFPGFEQLSDNRKAALLNLAFNMGPGLSAFHKMIAGVNSGDFNEAAKQLQDSTWFKQVQPSRSERLIKMIREG